MKYVNNLYDSSGNSSWVVFDKKEESVMIINYIRTLKVKPIPMKNCSFLAMDHKVGSYKYILSRQVETKIVKNFFDLMEDN